MKLHTSEKQRWSNRKKLAYNLMTSAKMRHESNPDSEVCKTLYEERLAKFNAED